GAQLMRIERAMTGLVQPAGVFVYEGALADGLPVSDPGGIPAELGLVVARTVVGGALAREPYRHVRIALAGGEAVAHADDEEIGDARQHLRHLPAADFDLDPGTGRIGNLQLHRRVAGKRYGLASATASARRGQPGAVHHLRIGQPVETGSDHVALG